MPPDPDPGAGAGVGVGAGVAALPLAHYAAASDLLRALAAPIRLAIVALLTHHDELHVHQLVEAVGVPQALVSQHLRVLRQAQVVRRVQIGRHTVYRLSHPAARPVITAVLAAAGGRG